MTVKETVRDYVEIFNALLTPLIAILAAFIAWQQYQVSHFSLKNELYERRFKVFKAFMSYLEDIMREGKSNYWVKTLFSFLTNFGCAVLTL